MKNIGLIVNPVAGMGGSVGLKGTDGVLFKKALELGAEPVSDHTTNTFLDHIPSDANIFFVTGPGNMGESYLRGRNIPFEIINQRNYPSSADDTKLLADLMMEWGIGLLVFVGGDGTARDIYDAVELKVPVIAVPAGVKVYSSVFSYSAEAAAKLLTSFLEGAPTSSREVLDIDEDAYRAGKLISKLYGFLEVPEKTDFVQPGKATFGTIPSNQQAVADASAWIVDKMDHSTLYFLGPGSTIKGITDTVKKDILAELHREGATEKSVADAIRAAIGEKDISEARAKTIANTEIGGMIADTQLAEFLGVGVTRIQWQTMGDGKVRPTHQLCDGRIVTIGDPFPNGLLYPHDPGGGPEEVCNCRCWFTPVEEER